MKIIVLNGSPKGETSVTMQYIKYIENTYKSHQFEYINISQKINQIEKNVDELNQITKKIEESDGIIFATPVYFMVVPAQYKLFIELIYKNKKEYVFNKKHCFILVTSINFYDHTSVNYLHSVCDDLNMNVVSTFSANMQDILKEENQKKLVTLGKTFFNAIENKELSKKVYYPVIKNNKELVFVSPITKLNTDKKIVIITTAEKSDENLNKMTEHFINSFENKVEIYNLNEINMKFGCLGCLNCGFDNICVIKDDFTEFYNSKIKPADIIIFATTIKDRHLSSRLKMLFDRSFFNGHTPSLKNKQMGFIISGELGQNFNIKEMINGFAELQKCNLVDVVTDEDENSGEFIYNLAKKSIYYLKENYFAPKTFLGIGGMKIFRDDIYSHLKVIFQKDHQYYKKNKIYDFPTKRLGKRFLMSFLYLLVKLPFIQKEVRKKMKDEMIKDYKKIADSVK